MRQPDSDRLLWFFAGASVGAILAALLTPASGSETRRLLSRKVGEAKNFLEASGSEYVERGRHFYDQGRGLADEAANYFGESAKLVDDEAG